MALFFGFLQHKYIFWLYKCLLKSMVFKKLLAKALLVLAFLLISGKNAILACCTRWLEQDVY